jgi:tripartite-type tricarboxylate transporter receptor subunit TctC
MPPIFCRVWFALLLFCPLAPLLAADTYPQRPLRLIVPFPPGGAGDTVARMVAQKLGDTFGQQVVVDNRPGGGTIIATEIGAKAIPDGHTLLVVSAAFTVNPSLYKKLPYDTEKDFIPVTQTWSAPNLLIVNPSLPAGSVKELIAYAKANPGKINFGSAGNGTSTHLAGEMFRTMAGIDIVHVPYKGDAPAIADLIGGQIQMLFISLGPVAQLVKTGRVKALAVSSSNAFSLVPDLPTVASGGLPGFESSAWNGIAVPRATPAEIVSRLQAEIARILAQSETREKMFGLGFEPIGNTPPQFKAFIGTEIKRMAKLVSDAGIRIN